MRHATQRVTISTNLNSEQNRVMIDLSGTHEYTRKLVVHAYSQCGQFSKLHMSESSATAPQSDIARQYILAKNPLIRSKDVISDVACRTVLCSVSHYLLGMEHIQMSATRSLFFILQSSDSLESMLADYGSISTYKYRVIVLVTTHDCNST